MRPTRYGPLKISLLVLAGTAASVHSAPVWQSLPYSKPVTDSLLLGVGAKLWVAEDSGILVTDTAGLARKWLTTPFPSGKLSGLKMHMGRIFAATAKKAWWVTDDSGSHWSACGAACLDPFLLPSDSSAYGDAGVLLAQVKYLPSPSGLLMSVPGAVLRRVTRNDQSAWEVAAMGWGDQVLNLQKDARGLLAIGDVMYTDRGGGEMVPNNRLALRSTDGGATWRPVPRAQSHCMTAVESQGTWICKESDTSQTLAVSKDLGRTWSTLPVNPVAAQPLSQGFQLLDYYGPWVAWFLRNGKPWLYFSVDNGAHWSDRTPADIQETAQLGGFQRMGTAYALLGDNSTLYVTLDSGRHWQKKPLPESILPTHQYYSMVGSTDYLWLTTNAGHDYRSGDLGTTWTPLDSTLYTAGNLGAQDSLITAGRSLGLSLSPDEGKTWEYLPTLPQVVHDKIVWSGQWWAATEYGLYSSSYSGASWKSESPDPSGVPVYNLETRGDSIFILARNGFYLGTGAGSKMSTLLSFGHIDPTPIQIGDGIAQMGAWVFDSTQQPYGLPNRNGGSRVALIGKEARWISTQGVFGARMRDSVARWFPQIHGNAGKLPVGLGRTFVAQDGRLSCLTGIGLFESADSGASWSPTPAPLDFSVPAGLARGLGGIFLSTANWIWFRAHAGEDWRALDTLGKTSLGGLLFATDSLAVRGWPSEYYLRNRLDSTWRMLGNLPGSIMAAIGNSLFAQAQGKLYASRDAGATWQQPLSTSCPGGTWQVLPVGAALLAHPLEFGCIDPAVAHAKDQISTDGGKTWARPDTSVFPSLRASYSGIASGNNSWVFTSKNWIFPGNASPVEANAGMPQSIAVLGNRFYAFTADSLKWAAFPSGTFTTSITKGTRGAIQFPTSLIRPEAFGGLHLQFNSPFPMSAVLVFQDIQGRVRMRTAARNVLAGPNDWFVATPGPGPWIVHLVESAPR
ncbi:MAG: hypothetical protein JF616_01615 [Fibrobacteres bacterium]|nr:hypothetical protein [Fibrobacterota bacterium]